MEFYSLHVRESGQKSGAESGADGPDFILIPETMSHMAGWFAGPFWFAYHGLYLTFLADAGLLLVMAGAFKVFAFTKWGIFVVLFAERFLIASFAHDIRRHYLGQKGYEERGSLLAEDEDMAEELALDALLGQKKNQPGPEEPEIPLPQAPAHRHRRGPLAPFASPFENN